MNNLEKLKLYKRLREEIEPSLNKGEYYICTHLYEPVLTFSAWLNPIQEASMKFRLTERDTIEVVSSGRYSMQTATQIAEHIEKWCKTVIE